MFSEATLTGQRAQCARDSPEVACLVNREAYVRYPRPTYRPTYPKPASHVLRGRLRAAMTLLQRIRKS